MRTAIGHGLLDPKARLKCFRNRVNLCCRKGMRLIFLKLVVDAVWQHKRARRHRIVPLEEFSFLLNCFKPRNWIIQRGGLITGRADHFTICQVRSIRSMKIRGRYLNARQIVPTTASGLQGQQPLVKQKNVDKGIRQNRSVTSGKGLALRTGWICDLRLLRKRARQGCKSRMNSSPEETLEAATINSQLRTEADKGNPTV